ncbi:MAG: BLUF domain-containing protein [Janthinobacterium lividum]
MSDLYRLVYTSRNHLEGGEDQQQAAVAGVLAVSKRNNARVGVTGALLFNGGSFAQVLEGSRAAVETTFERIQRDTRHSDVAVLQCEAVATRAFPNWSMGFIGNSPRGRALWAEVARLTNFDLSRLEGNVLFNTLLSIVKAEEGEATQVSPGPDPAGLDVAQLRTELLAQRPGERAFASPALVRSKLPEPAKIDAPALVAQEIEAGVLRTALDAERSRTTALRRELDEAQIALKAKLTEASTLQAQADALNREVELLRRHRDVWADRAKAMAAIMIREPTLDGEDIRNVA